MDERPRRITHESDLRSERPAVTGLERAVEHKLREQEADHVHEIAGRHVDLLAADDRARLLGDPDEDVTVLALEAILATADDLLQPPAPGVYEATLRDGLAAIKRTARWLIDLQLVGRHEPDHPNAVALATAAFPALVRDELEHAAAQWDRTPALQAALDEITAAAIAAWQRALLETPADRTPGRHEQIVTPAEDAST